MFEFRTRSAIFQFNIFCFRGCRIKKWLILFEAQTLICVGDLVHTYSCPGSPNYRDKNWGSASAHPAAPKCRLYSNSVQLAVAFVLVKCQLLFAIRF